jgi:hypothetical protein
VVIIFGEANTGFLKNLGECPAMGLRSSDTISVLFLMWFPRDHMLPRSADLVVERMRVRVPTVPAVARCREQHR